MRTLFQFPDKSSNAKEPKRTLAVSRRQFLLSAAAVTASLGCQARSATSKPMNVVVFLADTVRADHMSCYGHAFKTTPILDAFSRESIVFDHCYAQCCWTKPSIASLFSGVLPQVHQAGDSDWDFASVNDVPVQMLRPCFTTLGEQFSRLGYRTAYLLSNSHVQERFGFARGFDHYEFKNSWPAAEQIQSAVEWLKKEAQEPFFLFVHEIDPHEPNTPSDAHYQRLFGKTQEEAMKVVTPADLVEEKRMEKEGILNDAEPLVPIAGGFFKAGVVRPKYSDAAEAFYSSCYDAELLGVDEQFGRVLTCLREMNVQDRTAVVFTSDHGQSFGEHGWYGHGKSLHNPELRVPLIVRLPASMRRSERVPWSVSMFDLYPTLVSLAGGTVAEGLQAKTLLHKDGRLAVEGHRECYSAHGQPGQEISQWNQALIQGPWKAHLTEGGARISVYNLDDDPGENNDLLANGVSPPPAVQEFIDRFKKTREKQFEISASYGKPVWVSGGDSYKEELSALGYL